VTVTGPLGEPVIAEFGLLGGADESPVAVIEMASASGLPLVPPDRRDPSVTTTYGTGELLSAALDAGSRDIIIGIGGSATNDGGAGMAQALGYRLTDAGGVDIERGGEALLRLETIDSSRVDPRWRSVRVKVATDVTNPLTGPEGASHVYGPQKGADPPTVALLDQALAHFARVIERNLQRSVSDVPGAGAAGGCGAGLMAFLDAELVPGARLIVDAAGLPGALNGADLVITGEGRIDGQTAYGKAPGEVARRAQAAQIPVVFIAGSKGPGWDTLSGLGITEVVAMADVAGLDQALRDPEGVLERAAVVACRSHPWK
jgi:glycerate kinase